MSYMTFIFNNNIVPSTNKNAEIILANSLGKSFTNEQGEDIIFSKKGEILDPYSSYKKRGVTHLFYAWKFIDGQMLDVTVIDFSRLGFTQMLKAKKGIWNSDKNNWEFFEGDMISYAYKFASRDPRKNVSILNMANPVDVGGSFLGYNSVVTVENGEWYPKEEIRGPPTNHVNTANRKIIVKYERYLLLF